MTARKRDENGRAIAAKRSIDVFSAKGVVFILSLGQAPQDPENKKKSALKAPLIDTRFQRLVAGVIRIPGALPQAYVRKAPMALKLPCLL